MFREHHVTVTKALKLKISWQNFNFETQISSTDEISNAYNRHKGFDLFSIHILETTNKFF